LSALDLRKARSADAGVIVDAVESQRRIERRLARSGLREDLDLGLGSVTASRAAAANQ
jgi:hypothetical protein